MRKFYALSLFTSACLYLTTFAHALDVTLRWNAVNDPSPAGYRIYYDVDSGPPYEGQGALEGNSPVDVNPAMDEDPDPAVIEFTLRGLNYNQIYYFTVTAHDERNSESTYSGEVDNDSNDDGIPDDIVEISSSIFDGTAGTLEVVATSSDQPQVFMTAEGLGVLNWKSRLNFYRNTFSGVTQLPATLTVRSSGGGSDELDFTYDGVIIGAVTYDFENDTLQVSATSTDQPDVTLTAEGFGNLDWKSWLSLYRNTFHGVSEKPSSVTVHSSGGGQATKTLAQDVITIMSVTYDDQSDSLEVSATSSEQPKVQLTAEGFGNLDWKSWRSLYRNTFYGVSEKPASVTVHSSGGGQATNTLAQDVITIMAVIYDDQSDSLEVSATSSEQPKVQLTAEGFGNLDWKSWRSLYRNTFYGVSEKPASIRVYSSGGGSATEQVP